MSEHTHKHDHALAGFGRAFAIGIALNAAFVLIEAIYGCHQRKTPSSVHSL